MRMTKRVSAGVALWVIGAVALGQGAAEVNLNIKAQPIADALNQWAQATGLQVIFPEEEATAALVSVGVRGKYEPREALARLLGNSGLRYEFLNERTVAIVPIAAPRSPESKPAAHSNTSVETKFWRVAQNDQSNNSTISSTSSSTASDTSTDSSKSVELQEILVTATKRTESILDVPLSVSAFDQSALEERGVSELGDILRSVPGVYMHDADGFNSAIVVRGLTQTVFYQNTGAGPTVSTYFDETPITFAGSARVGTSDVRFFDIERLEVLRGPQGTTFGDASLTGAVRIIPAAPKLNELEGSFNSEFSETGSYGGSNNKLEGVINLPLASDKFALRASVYRHDNSGFYRTVSGSNPTSVALNTAMGSLAYAVDREDQGANIALGGRIAALWQVSEDLSIEAAFFRQEVEQDGQSWAEVGTHENIHSGVHPEQRIRNHSGAVVDSQIQISSVKGKYDLTWGNVLASVSWLDSGVQWNWPGGPLFGLPWSYLGVGTGDSVTAEIRLASNLDGRLQFQGGFYHERIDATHRETTYHLGTVETNFFYDDPFMGDSIYADIKTQDAIFGEVSYDLTQRLRLTGGLRYYQYERRNEVELKGGQFGFPSPDAGDGGNAFSLSNNDAIYKFDISYRPGEDTLIYGLWSQGFRLGRAQPGVSRAICDPDGDGLIFDSGVSMAQTRQLVSDSVDNLELGAKSSMLDGRMTMNAAVFHDKWTDIPTLVHFGSNQGPVELASCIADINVGEAEATGVEFQASILATKSLRVDVGGAYVEAKYLRDAPGIGVEKGDKLPSAPKLNWNLSAYYDFRVFNHSSYFRVDSHYTGRIAAPQPLPDAGDYVTVDASIGTVIGSFEASLFVSNLTDKKGIITPWYGSREAGFYTRPRTVGVRLKYGFSGR